MQHQRVALLALLPSILASTGCHPAVVTAPESTFVRVEPAPPEPLDTRFGERPKSAPAHVERTSLYGLSLVLPAGWSDEGEILFSSEAGPLLKLAFIVEPLTSAELDEWMERAVRNANTLGSAEVHRFDNPVLSIRGLALQGAKTAGKQWIISIAFDTHTVVAHPTCLADCDRVLEIIFRTMRSTREQSAPLEPTPVAGGRFLLRAGELEFESPQKLENPDHFRFEANDHSGELWCSRSSVPDQLDGPEWHEDFELESKAQVTEYAVEPLSISVFQGQLWFATVDEPEGRRELTYAEVSTRVESVTFQCVFQREGAIRESAELLEAVLSSARRD